MYAYRARTCTRLEASAICAQLRMPRIQHYSLPRVTTPPNIFSLFGGTRIGGSLNPNILLEEDISLARETNILQSAPGTWSHRQLQADAVTLGGQKMGGRVGECSPPASLTSTAQLMFCLLLPLIYPACHGNPDNPPVNPSSSLPWRAPPLAPKPRPASQLTRFNCVKPHL